MSQIFESPYDEWLKYIANLWILGNEVSKELINEELDSSLDDLRRLQEILNLNKITSNETNKLYALGIVFGKTFIHNVVDFDWWIVEDKYGKDICIRYKETSLLIFPQTIISKRVEDGEEINVLDIFDELQEYVDKIQKEHYGIILRVKR